MKTLNQLLDFLKPAARRTRPPSQPELNDQVLGRLSDTDAVYRALMDHAFAQAEQSLQAALAPRLDPHDRAFLCGQTRGLVSWISAIEDTRERARAEQHRRQQEVEKREQARGRR